MDPVVVVLNQPSCPPALIADVLELERVPYRVVEAYRSGAPTAPDGASGVVVMGGAMNADEDDRHPHLPQVRALLRTSVERSVPVLGVCLGAQLLARALGAAVRRAPHRTIGFHPVTGTDAARADAVVGPFLDGTRVFMWHEDTFDVPSGAEPLATGGPDRLHHAFRAGAGAYGIQFHFEVTEAIVMRWCDETPDLERDWGVRRDEVLAMLRDGLPGQRAAATAAVRAWTRLARDASVAVR